MKIRYTGPAEQVSLPDAHGTTFRRGEPVEVDEPTARRLLKQDTFEKVEPVKPAGRGAAAAGRPTVETR